MSNIYGKNTKLGFRHERAAEDWLKSRGFKVYKASFLQDVRDKCDLIAKSPKGQEYAIQVKSANGVMTVEDQRKLIDGAKRHNKLPRLIRVRNGFMCNGEKLSEDK